MDKLKGARERLGARVRYANLSPKIARVEVDVADIRALLAQSEDFARLRAALEAVRPFVETEVENRGYAGSDMTDYQDEARQALDTIDAALTIQEGDHATTI